MAVPYERYEDEIEAADNPEDQSSLSSDEESSQRATYQGPIFLTSKQRYQEVFRNRWPRYIGLLLLLAGFLCAAVAVVNIIILPLVEVMANQPTQHISLDKSNLFGLGLWAGLMLVLTGSLGLRAAVYNSVTTVYLFFALVLFSILAFVAFMLLIVVGYSDSWIGPSAYKDGGALFYTQVVVNVFVAMGLVLLLVAFTQYYENVCCGELQCLRRLLHCCLPCWCPRVVEPEEMLSEDGRPPSLPI